MLTGRKFEKAFVKRCSPKSILKYLGGLVQETFSFEGEKRKVFCDKCLLKFFWGLKNLCNSPQAALFPQENFFERF